MGSNVGMPDERPAHIVRVETFRLDRSPVTVGDFARFAKETGYSTSAEKFGNSGVFDMHRGEWRMVDGANWRHPLGKDASSAPNDHPVTQVSWFDADTYCRHAGGRLPTEAEFEYAAKGAGQYGNPVYAFGEHVTHDGEFLVNIFTGHFPFENDGADGYTYTAPVGKTGITPLGLTDMAGNVWEWSNDWYRPYVSSRASHEEKSLRGGSFLCDEKVCHGYRTTARSHASPETSLVHVGFRCAYDLKQEPLPEAP
ncbi:MAG: formylglycine-generating enzyme family protein [Pseudomonadales bacterium]|nr:formylglycine-generating enzyme family protein [Pseudomonadales bacterium]